MARVDHTALEEDRKGIPGRSWQAEFAAETGSIANSSTAMPGMNGRDPDACWQRS
jgi:hypothetical protein